jgi:serine O-acetyltransferase
MAEFNNIRLIKSDLFRYTGNTLTRSLFKLYIINSYFRFQVYLRLSNSNNFFVSLIFKLLKARLGKKVNVQINSAVPIGYGLYIPHGNVVVNSKTKIGNNCSLLQFVSIGAIHNGVAACIEDNVYVGPNSNIVGSINIGCNSVLGAGTVAVRDIESNSIVVGSPAKVIKKINNINDYCENLCNSNIIKKLKI